MKNLTPLHLPEVDNIPLSPQNGFYKIYLRNGVVYKLDGNGVETPLGNFIESDPIFTASVAYNISTQNTANWNTAYGWGNHATQGYLKVETDPIFTASPAFGISNALINQWITSYNWGNHAVQGYLTQAVANTLYAGINHTHSFAQITGKPTTLTGYGITDPVVLTSNAYSDPAWITALSWNKIVGAPSFVTALAALTDVQLSTLSENQVLRYSNGFWRNWSPNFLTQALADTLYLPFSSLGVPNGVASLNGSGQVPASQLPSYVDDVLEYVSLATFPTTGETGKIYLAQDTNEAYRWSGSSYIKIANGAVQSVNTQTGNVVLDSDDINEGVVNLYYSNAKVKTYADTLYVALTGSYSNPSWITSLAWSKITGVPPFITGIDANDVVTALGYSPVTNSRTLTINGVTFDLTANRTWTVGDILSTGSYANPDWITSLAWTKITGVPSFLTGSGTTNYVTKWSGSSLVDSIIFENGGVGIGTNNPSTNAMLHVVGGLPSRTKSLLLDSTWNYQTSFSMRNGNFSTEFNLGGTTKSSNEGGPGSLQVSTYNATTNTYRYPVTFYANGNVAFAGNLGSVPADNGNTLQVNGTIQQNSVTSALLKASATGVLVAAVPGVDYLVSVATPTLDTVTTAGNVTTNAITVGNVTVNGNAGTGFFHNALTNYDGLSGLQLNRADGTERAFFKLNPFSGEVRIGAAGTGYYTTFYTASAERMRIFAASGNVAINTTTDSGFKLDVNGTARVSELTIKGSGIALISGLVNTTPVGDFSMNETFYQFRTYAAGTSFLWKVSDGSNKMDLTQAGVLRLYALAGTGTRMVVADEFGQLSVQAVPTYSETDTLASVTTRGNVTTNAVTVGGITTTNSLTIDGTGSILVSETAYNNNARIGTRGGYDFLYGAFRSLIIGTNPNSAIWGVTTDSARNLNIWHGGNYPIVFATNNAERMRIASSGNVLIGTTTDSGYTLNISGTFRVTSQADFVGLASPGHSMARINDNGTLLRNDSFVIDNATGNAGQLANLSVGATHGTAARLFVKGSGSTSATTSYLIQNSSSTELFRVYDEGTVKGGTNFFLNNTSPFNATPPFTVLNQYSGIMSVAYETQWGHYIGATHNGGTGDTSLSLFGLGTGGGYNGAIRFWTSANSRTPVLAMIVDRNQNVGIGLTNSTNLTASAKLHVAGLITATSALAQGVFFNNTLVAAANNDVLVGLDVNPSFNTGAFTGVTTLGLRSFNGFNLYSTGGNGHFLSATTTTSTDGTLIFRRNGGNNGAVRLQLGGSFQLSADDSTGEVRLGVGAGGYFATIHSNGSEAMRIPTTRNVLIGTTTDAGYKLDVNGTFRTVVSTETNAFRFEHTNGNYMTMVVGAGSALAAGQFGMYFNASPIWSWNGSAFRLHGNFISTAGPNVTMTVAGGYGGGTSAGVSVKLVSNAYNAGALAPTSGVQTNVEIGTGSNESWTSSSGNATWNLLSIAPTINTSGSYSGIVRGLYINPVLTSVTGATVIAIEATSGSIKFGTLSGSGSRMVVADANGVLSTQAIPAASTTPTLDQVTTAGNITTNTITVGGITSNGAISFNTPSGGTYGLYWTPAQDGTQVRIFGSNYSVVGYNTLNVMSGLDGLVVNGNERKLTINAAGSSIYLDTVNMIFTSHGTGEAMRIVSSSKNLLIGTTTDAGYKVDINGTLRASGRILQGFGGFVNNCLYTYISNHCGSAGLIGFGFTNTDNPVAGDSVFDIYQGVAAAPDAALFNFKHSILNGINSVDQSFIAVTGTINRSASVSGIVRGIYYNPTTTAVNGTHYAWESTSGKFKISDLSGTGTRMVVADANGVLGTQAIPTGGGGSVTSVGLTIGTSGTDINVSNSPITSAGDIVLNIPNASETARGVVSTANQTFVGKKTFKATSLVIDTTATSSLLEGKVNGVDHGYIYFGPYFQFTATASATSGFLWKIGDGTNAMELAQTGRLRFNKYGINTFEGTATKGLGVDADGYVVEYTIPASGGSISLTTTGSSGAATLVGTTLNIPTYTLTGLGGVPTSRTLTINGVTFDLTADRSWTVTAATPTLAEVTTAGDTTTNAITVGGLTVNTNDATIRTLRIGLGAGSVATNMAIGVTALNSNSTGTENTAIGYEALYLSTGIQSTVVGYRAGKSIVSQSITAIGHTSFTLATGTGNTGLGRYSGSQTTTGAYNTAVGESALSLNTTGVANTAVGYNSVGYFGAGTHSKSENVGVGYFALAELISGNNNVAVGVQALWSLSAGSSNTAIGWRALAAAAQSNNTAVGFESLRNNSTASGNVAVGYRAGYTNSTGTNITAIGYEALYSSTGSESTAVGYQAGRTIIGNTITAIGYQAGYQTTGTENTVIGNGALINNTSGAYNTMIGHRVAFGWFGNINPTYTGTGNTSVGHGSMYYLQNGSQNVALGISALFGLRDGSNNVAIGSSALSSNNASGNVAVGWRAAFTNTTASEFVAIGYEALYTASTNIDGSVAIGYQAARNATAAVTAIGRSALLSNTGARNTAVGIFAMSANTSGMENTAMGYNSMNLNKTGSYNTAYGYRSLMGSWTGNASPVYSGSQNVAIGFDAMVFAETASENTAVGTQALYATQSGNFNAAVGLFALGSNNGNNNTAIGYKAGGFGVANTTGANNIFIGYQATGVSATESNRTWIGNSSTTSTWLAGNVLIGTTTNSDYKLDVNGSFRNNGLVVLTTLSAVTTTQILYYDAATGVVTYGAAPGGGGYVTTAVTTSYVESATSGVKAILVDTTSGTVTVTLPSAVGNTATLMIKKVAGTASLILDGAGSETIDGGATATIVEINEAVTLISNNSNWLIF